MKSIIHYLLICFVLYTCISCGDEPGWGNSSLSNPQLCIHMGHKYVDLGLPSGTKWATMNMGAKDTLDPGYHYRWGNTTAIELIDDEEFYCDVTNSKAMQPDSDDEEPTSPFEYYSISGTKFDVAHNQWKGEWRMPTKKDYEELFEYCTFRYDVINEKGGYRIEGPNGNHIFLPNTGHILSGKIVDATYNGYYWTATNCIELRFFKSKEIKLKSGDSYHGMGIRAVCNYPPSNKDTED